MIEMLKKLLLEKFEYELEDYALFEVSRGKSKILPVTGVLFAVASILLILDMTDVFPNFMNLVILIFLAVVLVIIPIAYQKNKKYDAIVVTPKYLIQRVDKSDFVVLEFDAITGFKIAKEGIIITENKKNIVLGMDMFREEIEPIVEILEAKGKTFDPKKDYMIRRINIIIADNKISIEDNVEETSTDKLYKKFDNQFPMLTPGFVDEVSFRNSMIETAKVTSGNLELYLNEIEVKGGHPENTTFDNLIAVDCVLIFEDIVFQKAHLEDLHKDEETVDLGLDVKEIAKHLKNGVISEWKSKGKSMEMVFATGVHQLSTKFKFKEVIIGWKNTK